MGILKIFFLPESRPAAVQIKISVLGQFLLGEIWHRRVDHTQGLLWHVSLLGGSMRL